MQGPPVDRPSCAVLPCQLSPYPDNLQRSTVAIAPPWRDPRHGDLGRGVHLKFAAVARRNRPRLSSHTVSCRQASSARAQVEQEETLGDLPSLPHASSQSLSVESWGSLYEGPHEAKYWNSSRKFPYTVGYTAVKTYKGKSYLQKIEEGDEGPVFSVEVIEMNKVFSANSPQKVWNEVVVGNLQEVHGPRHFGFQSNDVIKSLQALARYESGASNKEVSFDRKLDLEATSINKKSMLEDPKSDSDDDEFGLIEGIYDDNSDEERLAGFEGETDEDSQEEDENDDVNKDTERLGVQLEHDEAEDIEDAEDEEEQEKEEQDDDDSIEEQVLHDAEDHHVNANHDSHLDRDDDHDHDVEIEDEDDEEDENERGALSYNEYPTNRRAGIDDDSPVFDDPGPLLNNYKQSFMSTRTRSSFERAGRFDPSDESYKDDLGAITNNVYYPSDQGRSKVVGRVWRKGDSIVSRGKQKGIVRSGSEHRYPSTDESQPRASVALSFNARSWDATSGKKREENNRSSQMLLELLQKWNKTRNWNRDLKTNPQSHGENKSFQLGIDDEPQQDVISGNDGVFTAMSKPFNQDILSETDSSPLRRMLSSENLEDQEPLRITQSSSGNEELALDEFKINEDIDESTEFAIAKLFETIGKKEISSGGAENPLRLGKAAVGSSDQRTVNHVEKSWTRGGIGKPMDMDEYQMRLEVPDDTKFYRELGNVAKPGKDKIHVEPDPLFPIETNGNDGDGDLVYKENHLGSQLAPSLTRGVATFNQKPAEVKRLVNDVRKFVASKRYEDAFLAMRSAKAVNTELDVDVYEALLGDVQLATWQKEVFRHIQDGKSVLVSAPSGAGKTVAADCCIFRNYIEDYRTLLVTPSDHLAKKKMHSLGNVFGHRHVGGLTTRKQKDHKIVVLTLDSLAKMLQELHGPGGSEFRFFFEGINMVVLDKLHTLGDSNYANMWEEIFMLMDAKIKVLALTLPASNEDQIVSWIDLCHGPCKLVKCKTEPIMRRYLFCNGNGIFPLFDPEGVKLREGLLKNSEDYRNSMTKDQLDHFFLFGYDKLSLSQALASLKSNGMLPALVVFSNMVGCNAAMQDVSAAFGDCLLSDQELATVEARRKEIQDIHPDLMKHLEQADQDGLHRGFAACHEGKLLAWQDFALNLFQENVLKLLFVSENVVFHTGIMARTIILPSTCRVLKDGILPLNAMQVLPLFGSAGRKGYDVEGNVIFVQTSASGPSEAASLALKKDLDIVSNFKPSYSLLINLLAKYQIAKVKQLLSGTFHDVVYHHTHAREKKLQVMGEKILNCLESKGDLEVKLFQGLAEINKQKLADAAVFTRVDVRLTMRSSSHGGNIFPGFLLAVVPEKTVPFYMIFGADNNFHLLPAGALDHVYRSEAPPLDVLYKQSTGQTLQPPAIPPKEMWNIGHDGTGSYVARGNSQTECYVKLLMDYPVHMSVDKEGLQLRKEIFSLDSEILSLIEKRTNLRRKKFGSVNLSGSDETGNGSAQHDWDKSDTWKEAMRLLEIMIQADALSLTESQGAHVKLKPLGMLMSRLHNAGNELWLALVFTLSNVRQLQPIEFLAVIAATMPLETDVENLFIDQRDFSYRATKPMKSAFTKLEVLRKQVVALQGSLTPPLYFSTAFAGMVYAWARGKPGTGGFNTGNTNDGEILCKLKSAARHANSISQACTQASVDILEPNDFSGLSILAKKAEESLSRHLLPVD